MTLEVIPRFPRHFPRPHFPHRRFYGGGWPVPVYYEPQVIEVERTEVVPALPWRIVQQVSGGSLKVVSQHASMEDALKAFKEGQARVRKLRPRCQVTFLLQHWSGSAWATESTWSCP
jgi:hypothetical protein